MNTFISDFDKSIDNSNSIDCKYYDYTNIQNAFNCDTSNIHDLFILHIKVRSINNIIHFIDSIHKQFSISIIIETWLNDSNNKLYNLSDYNSTVINRSSYRGVGV